MKITIQLHNQTLRLVDGDKQKTLAHYSISSAEKGPGQLKNSFCTPTGKHIIRAKIGQRASAGSVFVGRRPTGEIYNEQLRRDHPNRDWILTRILWLSGLELGHNRLGQHDSMQRYIYIHGTPDDQPMGIPKSHGCIRMRNLDIIELFDLVPVYTPVDIQL